MDVLCRLLMVTLLATLTFALPQYGEDFVFENDDASLQRTKHEMILFPLGDKIWRKRPYDDDYEGSAMGGDEDDEEEKAEEGHQLYLGAAITSKRRRRGMLNKRELYSRLARCPSDDVYTCDSGDVICDVQMCDGVADCPSWEDEMDCGPTTTTTTTTTRPPYNTTTTTTARPPYTTTTTTARPPYTTTTTTTARPLCKDGARPRLCRDGKTQACFCDGVRECWDGEDERYCYHGGCRPWEWRCRCDGACIPRSDVCNCRKDCRDGSDERGCVPGIGWWRCKYGGWIRMWQRCDGRQDCLDGSDERFCPQHHHCHGTHHWLLSVSPQRRLQHLLKAFEGDNVVEKLPMMLT